MNENNINKTTKQQYTEQTKTPAWMSDASIAYIPKEKLDFLTRLMAGTQNLSKNEMLQYVPRLAREAKEHHIQFTRDEMHDIIAAIRNHSSDEEKQTIDKMLSSKPF